MRLRRTLRKTPMPSAMRMRPTAASNAPATAGGSVAPRAMRAAPSAVSAAACPTPHAAATPTVWRAEAERLASVATVETWAASRACWRPTKRPSRRNEKSMSARPPQIEERGADQVADVLDEEQRPRGRLQHMEPARQHLGVEVAAAAGVDLHGARAGGADALGVAQRFLVALD